MADGKIETALIVNLSESELSLLMRMLNIPALPGFKLADEPNTDRVEAAEQSLRAREVIQRQDDGGYLVDELVAAMIASGVTAPRAISVTHVPVGEAATKDWFYIAPGLTVHHSRPEPGIHHFQTVPDGMSFMILAAAALHIDIRNSDKPDADPVDVPKALWDHIAGLLKDENQDEAFQVLVDEGYPESFARAAAHYHQRNIVAVIEVEAADQLSGEGLLVLTADDGHWLLEARQDGLNAIPNDSVGVLDKLASLLT